MVEGGAADESGAIAVRPPEGFAVSGGSLDRFAVPHYSESLYCARAFAVGAAAARFFPRPLLAVLGRVLGWFYAATHPAKVDTVRRNLRLLRKNPNGAALARRVFSHFGGTLADYFYLSRRPAAMASALIDEGVGYENLKKAHDAGKGCFIVMPHLSFFELGGYIMDKLGFRTTALSYPEPSHELGRWRAMYRQRWGVDTLEIGEDEFAFLAVLKELRKGRFVAALVDRPAAAHALPISFPGGAVPFSTGIPLLALMAQCPIVPVTVVRKSSGFYRLEALEPLWLEPQGSRQETVEYYTRKMAEALAPALEKHPEQWYQFVEVNPS
jgi:lauroyl/myristoyl acyltransferase